MFDDDAPIPDKPGVFRPRPARLPGHKDELTEAEISRAQALADQISTTAPNLASIEDVHYIAEIRSLMDDAKLLRAYSVRKNRTSGAEEIYNPVMFEKAMARRTAIVATAVRLVREICDQKSSEDFYRALVDAVSCESPAVRRRMMDRLQELNAPVAESARRWPVTIDGMSTGPLEVKQHD
jgi:hypothetical protein